MKKFLFAALALSLLVPALPMAHPGHEHKTMGTIASIEKAKLVVKSTDNKDVTFEQRGIMQTMVHPVHRPFKMPGWPVRVDGKTSRLTSSPMLGEHSEEILRDLGYSADDIQKLAASGVTKLAAPVRKMTAAE